MASQFIPASEFGVRLLISVVVEQTPRLQVVTWFRAIPYNTLPVGKPLTFTVRYCQGLTRA